MVRWIVGILIAFLLIDHIWIHLAGPYLEKLRGEYREELKRSVDPQYIELQQSYKKSIIDQILEKAKELLKRDRPKEGGK
ncbi:MAG: hypothetical protein ACK4OF_04560 [Aquificaceae bacterium]